MNPTKKASASAKATADKPAKKAPAKRKAAEGKEHAAADAAKPEPKAKASHGGISGIRIRLSAFDHRVLDEAAGKIMETAQRSGAVVHGPIPLPTRIRKFTVNKSTFVHKNARDQFEMRTHRRLIDLAETTFKTVESLQSLSLPSGVDIEIKMK
jgi:small subunit ribosomal protein S10